MTAGRTVDELRARYGTRYKWLVLLTAMVGTMASIMASTIVNVAIPDMSRHFAMGPSQAQWVSAGFMVALTMSMLLTPWMLERFGLLRTYSGALMLLAGGALAGGLSPFFGMMLAMRAVEGFAAGLLQPIPAVIVYRAFPQGEQGRAFGIFGFGAVLAPAIGPSVGGVLVQAFGWRSIFFVMLPFAAVGLALARRYMPVASSPTRRAPVDLAGLALVGTLTLSLLNGLIDLQSGPPWRAVALLAVSVGCLALFIRVQRRSAAPLMNLSLFDSPPFAAGALVALVYGMGLFGSTYLVPVFLQMALEYGAASAGMALLPAGLVLAVSLPVTGRLADRLPPHWLVTGGLALLAGSFALMASVGPRTPYTLLLLWVIVGRLGLAMVMPSLSLASVRGLDPALLAQGSSTITFTRQLGGAIGVSLAGIALEWRLHAHGANLTGQATDALARARAFDDTFIGVAVVIALAAVFALRMRPEGKKAGH